MTVCSSSCLSTCTSLPSYYTGEPPRYTCRHSCGEQSLQETPRLGISSPCGSYLRTSGGVSLTLFSQEEGSKIPTYGRGGTIAGVITLNNPNLERRLLKVTMKVAGKLEVVTSEGGSRSKCLLSSCSILWRRDESKVLCPGFFSFSYTLPRTTILDNSEHPLPPSYSVDYLGAPTLFVKSKYFITFQLKLVRSHTLDLLTKMKTITIPFQYLPRTHTSHPLLFMPQFLTSIKSLPEEWHQIGTPISARANASVEPLHCQFFIPSSKVYGIRDKIPFHIQLSGSISSLKAFIIPDSPPVLPSTRRPPSRSLMRPKTNFTVTVIRQTTVETAWRGTVWRKTIIGNAKVQQVVPLSPPYSLDRSENEHFHLDWDGEIHIDARVQVGSFIFADISVMDSIHLLIEPFAEEKRPPQFRHAVISVPIRLVTDSFAEEMGVGVA